MTLIDRPVVVVDGVRRFKGNPIVRRLLDYATEAGAYNLNRIHMDLDRGDYSFEDVKEFYQLLGYSTSGYAEIFGEI